MADIGGIDPTKVSPEEFATLVGNADDDQIADVIHAVGTRQVLDRIFDGMQERFRPDKAQGVEARIQFVITDDGNEHPYGVEITQGSCRAAAGEVDDAKVMITTDVVSFSKMVAGEAEGTQLFMRGKLRAKGDLMFAARMMSFFERPTRSS